MWKAIDYIEHGIMQLYTEDIERTSDSTKEMDGFIIDIDKDNNITGVEFLSWLGYEYSDDHLEVFINKGHIEYGKYGYIGKYKANDIVFWYSERHELISISFTISDFMKEDEHENIKN